MKTVKQVIKSNPEYKSLTEAVIENLGGTDYVKDINNHGMGGGFPGFTYYNDTHAFAIQNRDQIIKLLDEQSDQLGYADPIVMVSKFNYFSKYGMDKEDRMDLIKYIGGANMEQCSITNLMAWFAAEEVCRMFEND